MEKLIQELKKTKRKSYKYLAKRLEQTNGEVPKHLKRECMIVLVEELDKYENDELINQLLLFLGKKIETEEEKANRK